MKMRSLVSAYLCAMIVAAVFISASSAQAEEAMDTPSAQSVAVPTVNLRDLAAVSNRLNEISTLKANFTQIDSQGTASGRFYLARPGGLRFEYDPPRKLLVIANNRTVLVREREGVNPYRAGVDQTPLKLLLKPNVDLARDANVIDAHRQGGLLYVTVVQTKGYGQGQVTFMFSEPSLRLERWVVTDPMGAQTLVTLSDLKEGASLDKSLFKLPQPRVGGFGPAR